LNYARIGLGGGCHWCTEAVFQQLRGVSTVEQGFIKSTSPHDAFSEAVLISYDNKVIDTVDLIEIHLRTHSSTSNHALRDKYRSAVYYLPETSELQIKQDLDEAVTRHDKGAITQALPFVEFCASASKYQNYFKRNPAKQFCETYINPKLSLLREKYSTFLDVGKVN
jgi:peptide-methionine (S)-S-oxide reductase